MNATPKSTSGAAPNWHPSGQPHLGEKRVGAPDITDWAEFTPPTLRPVARVLALLVANGPRWIGLIVVPCLIALLGIFIAGELVEMYRDYWTAEAAIQQARLQSTQEKREAAETAVALVTVRRVIADEIHTIVERETGLITAIKHVEENYGYAQTRFAVPAMQRYQKNYTDAKNHLRECESGASSCLEADRIRFAALMDAYDMLFYGARASFWAHVVGSDRVETPSQNELQR